MTVMNSYNYKKPIGMRVPEGSNKDIQSNTQAVKAKSDVYLEQKILNARPEELTYMLYDGIIKFVKQALLFNGQKTYDKSNTANIRAQAILQELRSSLNMEIDMSHNLENLYLFMIERLVDANLNKSDDMLEEVLGLATDLRDTWKQAMNL